MKVVEKNKIPRSTAVLGALSTQIVPRKAVDSVLTL